MESVHTQIINGTLKVWQPRSSNYLTCEDARQIAENFIGFFQLLLQWDADNSSADIVNATVGLPNPVGAGTKEGTAL